MATFSCHSCLSSPFFFTAPATPNTREKVRAVREVLRRGRRPHQLEAEATHLRDTKRRWRAADGGLVHRAPLAAATTLLSLPPHSAKKLPFTTFQLLTTSGSVSRRGEPRRASKATFPSKKTDNGKKECPPVVPRQRRQIKHPSKIFHLQQPGRFNRNGDNWRMPCFHDLPLLAIKI